MKGKHEKQFFALQYGFQIKRIIKKFYIKKRIETKSK